MTVIRFHFPEPRKFECPATSRRRIDATQSVPQRNRRMRSVLFFPRVSARRVTATCYRSALSGWHPVIEKADGVADVVAASGIRRPANLAGKADFRSSLRALSMVPCSSKSRAGLTTIRQNTDAIDSDGSIYFSMLHLFSRLQNEWFVVFRHYKFLFQKHPLERREYQQPDEERQTGLRRRSYYVW